jgi:DNA-binding protein HU-beta
MHCGHSHFCLACKGKVEQGARCQSFTKGNPVNKSQLIDALAARYEGNKKAAAHALESVLDTITREVAKGEKVAITGFGSFE